MQRSKVTKGQRKIYLKKIILIIILSVFVFGCNKKTEYRIDDIWERFLFNKTKSNSTEIVIKLYEVDTTAMRSRGVEEFSAKKEFIAATEKQIKSFDEIFTGAEKTSYCCCPTAIYSVHFLNKKEELDIFYVDTLEFKNKIRLYEGSFQYSYLIEKQKWNNCLTIMTKK